MFVEILKAKLNFADIWTFQIRFPDAAVHLQRPDCCHQNNRFRPQVGLHTFDIKELFCTEIKTKSRFGHSPIGIRHCHLRGNHRIASMRNIRKRTAMYQRRNTVDGLHQIR